MCTAILMAYRILLPLVYEDMTVLLSFLGQRLMVCSRLHGGQRGSRPQLGEAVDDAKLATSP